MPPLNNYCHCLPFWSDVGRLRFGADPHARAADACDTLPNSHAHANRYGDAYATVANAPADCHSDFNAGSRFAHAGGDTNGLAFGHSHGDRRRYHYEAVCHAQGNTHPSLSDSHARIPLHPTD